MWSTKKIKALEIERDELKIKLEQANKNISFLTKTLSHVIEHPPKYKTGITMGNFLITEINLNRLSPSSIFSPKNIKLHTNILSIIMIGVAPFSKQEVEDEIKENQETYIYTVFDTEEKITKKFTESKLDAYFNLCQ